MHILQN